MRWIRYDKRTLIPDPILNGQTWALLVSVAVFAILALLEAIAPLRRTAASGDARLLANFVLGILAIAASALVPFGVQEAAVLAARQRIGLFQAVATPVLIQILTAIMVQSLAAYWLHRASHRFGLLWRIHAVHHSDRAVDLSTGFRNHPLESLLTLPTALGVVVLLGLDPDMALVLVTVGYLTAFWQHAAIRLPAWLERSLRTALVTPALHRLHHAEERVVHDSNYGDLLIVWDRLFGTMRRDAPDAVTVGLVDVPSEELALPDLLLRPFRPAPRPAEP